MDEALDKAPGGFVRFADDGRVQMVNTTLLDWLGLERSAVLGGSITQLLTVGGRIFYQTHVFPLLKLQGQVEEMFLPLRTSTGAAVPVLMSARRHEQAGIGLCDALFLTMHQRNAYEDALLEARKAAEVAHREAQQMHKALEQTHQELAAHQAELLALNAQLAVLVTTDALTGLLNRRAFQERLAEAVSNAERFQMPLSLLLIDADYFKQVNDTLGHQTGDAVLRALASLLRQNARQADFVARYGGEEFALILPNTTPNAALEVGTRLCGLIASQALCDIPLTVSIGAATLEDPIADAEALLRAADQALYAAKEQGRNQAVHSDQMFREV